MKCRVCDSPNSVTVSCKHSGSITVSYDNEQYQETVPEKMNLNKHRWPSDYLLIIFCGSCGVMQNGTWPIPTEKAKCAECGSYNLSEEPVLHCVACGCFVNESNQVE